MGRRASGLRRFLGPGLRAFDNFWPARPWFWILVFAGLYAAVWQLNSFLLARWADVVPDRLSLIFLPALVRVASVVVAGLAGIIGIFLGSIFVSLVVVGDPPVFSLISALASALGIFLAYLVVLWAARSSRLSFSLPVLLMLTVVYAVFNAVAHGLTWLMPEVPEVFTFNELFLMSMGDLLGVLIGFFIVRSFLKLFHSRQSFSKLF